MSVENKKPSFFVGMPYFGVEYSSKLLVTVGIGRPAAITRREPPVRRRRRRYLYGIRIFRL
jgi:hypothetical protein